MFRATDRRSAQIAGDRIDMVIGGRFFILVTSAPRNQHQKPFRSVPAGD